MTKLEKAAQAVAGRALDIHKDESVLIIADEPFHLARLLLRRGETEPPHPLLQVSSPTSANMPFARR